ncbi:4-galactosyl-N-acetylglucosaminide 3-alpha-L-fucosyltransferase 9-like [Hoplias malabaricus]|uniref:4-galactosyl-N-acetylglucosaminide 3-alpha-L-fucosyltransferase 9-like n=1 Tax=Hoplias malabaricus TaxID=27720 RepID=UPI003462E509
MLSKTSPGFLQRFVAMVFLLLCFGSIFFIYYKPNLSSWLCPEVTWSFDHICSDTCLQIIQNENIMKIGVNNSCVVDYDLVKQKLINDVVEEHNRESQEHTLVLMWAWPFGKLVNVDSCKSLYGISGCVFTDDRRLYNEANAVIFHHRDIQGDLQNLAKMPRPPRQKWVWMNMESPDNSVKLSNWDLFNLTSSYRQDSDVWVPYGRIVDVSKEDVAFQIPTKSKLVCWIVSNWNPDFRRVKYYNEFSQHINIKAYGRHFSRYVNNKDYPKIISSCKFYLSFENSIHKDYITEKLFIPMMLGTIPVVLGPSRENYEKFIPSDSFIHVDDFKSPQELAEHLKALDQNQEMYEHYFSWRKDFVAQRTDFGREHACRICDHVTRDKGYRVFKNLDKWYWP